MDDFVGERPADVSGGEFDELSFSVVEFRFEFSLDERGSFPDLVYPLSL
jgi:hypothetical protein